MKYVADVHHVVRDGIHKIAELREGEIQPIADMPHPDRVEIELDGTPNQPCMMYRYTRSGEFCGDTWHRNLEEAFAQAEYEYGLGEQDFRVSEA
jgi:hypothetical protein